jgi:3-isopropylmalate dehydratase small subunit
MARVVLKLEDDVSTDIIYPGRFMATVLPSETPQYAFADDPVFNRELREGKVPQGSVIVAGSNFGSGSSREQAASTLKGYEFVIVARSFARIFLQNAVNLGLQTVACRDIEADLGDDLEVTAGRVINHTTGKSFPIQELSETRRAIVAAGGLIPYVRRRLVG